MPVPYIVRWLWLYSNVSKPILLEPTEWHKMDNAEFLYTTGPFAGFLIPLFAWLARQESLRKGRAVRLGMEKARAKGQPIGRPVVVDREKALIRRRISQRATTMVTQS